MIYVQYEFCVKRVDDAVMSPQNWYTHISTAKLCTRMSSVSASTAEVTEIKWREYSVEFSKMMHTVAQCTLRYVIWSTDGLGSEMLLIVLVWMLMPTSSRCGGRGGGGGGGSAVERVGGRVPRGYAVRGELALGIVEPSAILLELTAHHIELHAYTYSTVQYTPYRKKQPRTSFRTIRIRAQYRTHTNTERSVRMRSMTSQVRCSTSFSRYSSRSSSVASSLSASRCAPIKYYDRSTARLHSPQLTGPFLFYL